MNKESILLVDDELLVLKSFQKDLQLCDFNVTLASNGEEALDVFEKNHFDLVLTDLNMPGIDGIELLKQVKKKSPDTGAIIITGYGDMNSVISALQLGADDYLLKPADIDEVLFRVNKFFQKQEYERKISRYQCIVSSSTDLIAIVDHDYTFLTVNASYEKVFQKDEKEIAGKTIADFFGRKVFEDKMKAHVDRCLAGEVVQFEDVFYLADRRCRLLNTSCFPNFSQNKQVDGVVIISRDVTDINQLTAKLRESEDRLRLALDAVSDGVWDRDLINDSVHYGDNWARLLGYRPEEIRGNNICWQDLLHPEDKKKAMAAVQAHLDGKTPRYEAEFRLQNKAGDWQWILARGKVVERDAGGKPLRFVGTHIDISRRKQAIKSLQESEERFRVIFDKSTVAMAIVSFPFEQKTFPGSDMTEVFNPALMNFFGCGADELQTKSLYDFCLPEDRGLDADRLQALQSGTLKNYTIEKRFVHRCGRTIWGKVSVVPLRQGDGNINSLLVMIEDITQRKEQEFVQQNAYNHLEQLVTERTAELARQKSSLEETNAALTVLLKKREQDKEELEEQMLANIKRLVEPYLEKIKKTNLEQKQSSYLDIIEANLNDITAPFIRAFSSKYIKLTPVELQIANLVKQGRSSKDIADIMNLSPETINNHRKHIRKKCGITNKKVNLSSILSSFSDLE